MKLDDISNQIYIVAINEAKLNNHEYITPEHFLYAALMFSVGKNTIISSGGNVEAVKSDLRRFFEIYVPKAKAGSPIQSFAFQSMLEVAFDECQKVGRDAISVEDIFVAFYSLKDSQVANIINRNKIDSVIGVDEDDMDEYQLVEGSEDVIPEDLEDNIPDLNFLNPYVLNMRETLDNDSVVMREGIASRTIQVLCRRTRNNVLYLGESGVGKSAVIESLIYLMQKNEVPVKLQDANIFYLDIYNILAGTKYKHDFEERFAKILREISKVYKPIVYIDEIHTLVSSSLNVTGILKPYISKGEMKFVASSTASEYQEHLRKDKAISKGFECIEVEEATIEESVNILRGIKHKYESYHGVKYTDDVIRAICELSAKHLKEKLLPDKAIDVMDEVGVHARINALDESKVLVNIKDVENTVAAIAQIPSKSISATEVEILRNFKENMSNEIFGQNEVLEKVAYEIKLAKSGLRDGKKPLVSFLFIGSAGVGKTEVAKQIARNFGIKLTRFDMNEFQEKYAAARFIGSFSENGDEQNLGLFKEHVIREPNSVLFFNDIEKAHADILNVILQGMERGFLTDAFDNKIDLSNTILIMSSGVGMSYLDKKVINSDDRDIDASEINQEICKYFSAEFRDKLDGVMLFNAIDQEMADLISRKTIDKLTNKLSKKKIKLVVTKSLMEYISYKGYSKGLGAKEIVRTVNLEIKPRLVEEMLFGDLSNGGEIIVSFSQNKIVFRMSKS